MLITLPWEHFDVRSRAPREVRPVFELRPGRFSRLSVCERRVIPLAGNEAVLQAAWRRLAAGASVKGRDGGSYLVLYPGRPAAGPGPDFRDAVLRGPDGSLMRGDVEIHVRASDWRAHRHHTDPRYNGVAFHVTGGPAEVLAPAPADETGRTSRPARTLSGRPMHLLVLGAATEPFEALDPAARAPGPGGPFSGQFPGPSPGPADGLTRLLDRDAIARAGDQRFLGKSAGLSIALRDMGGDEAAWAALLDCLGYSRNRRAFRGVARRLPWAQLRSGMDSGADALPMLMWAGGFGPKPPGLRDVVASPGVPAPVWTPGGRPDNSPERRLAASAVLAGRWRDNGPLKSIIESIRTASAPKDVIGSFRVMAGTPERGRDSGLPGSKDARALIGEGRAREIVVNAALPLAHGWSLMADRWDITEKAFQVYRDHPQLPANAITREMVSLLASRGLDLNTPHLIRGAREQQGLILLYRAMTSGALYVGPPATQKEQ